ncbi:5-formyltetrahydrofolate cycloligase [Euphorbia peplus]|nr:5-formyltetrahydrofolate cycloligase [Euphorbia peplus]
MYPEVRCLYKLQRFTYTSKLLLEIMHNPTKDGCSAKKIYVPRIEDKNSDMRWLNFSSMDDLIATSMVILEPAPSDHIGNEREDG